jgi:hypothetical protein
MERAENFNTGNLTICSLKYLFKAEGLKYVLAACERSRS